MNSFHRTVARAIGGASGSAFTLQSVADLGGGCINEAIRLEGTDGSGWFVKSNTSADPAMFAAEFDGLGALAATRSLQVPQPLCFGETEGRVWLAMEFLPLGAAKEGSQRQLGHQLATLHQIRQPYFGWHRDNTIGSTPQRNPATPDWTNFWREHRLGFQLELAARNGARFAAGDRLVERLEELFEGYEPQPSLLHGDLWSGNAGFLAAGTPVIFDPACYFGDREAEFGIITMFGGFTPEFFRGYDSVWPLTKGFARRLPLYELYHTLNHFNLFGSSYADRCEHLIDQLLRNP